MKKILFDAHTPYQLMVAAFVAYVYYSHDFTTVLIGSTSFPNAEDLKQKIQNSALFSRVEITDERSRKDILIEQINSFKLDDTEIFHFSSYAATSSCYLFNKLHKKATIILNEEGVATYDLFQKYKEFINLFPSNIRDDINLENLSEIWLFNKKIYNSDFKEKVKEIDLNQVENEFILIKKLNNIFDYKFSEIKEKNIFFTQIFLDYGVISEEENEDFFKKMVKQLNGDLILKLHPYDNNTELYNKLNIKTLQNIDKVPWELILLNHLLEKKLESKTFLTVGSTSLGAFNLFLKYKKIEQKHKYVLMTKLLQTPFNEAFEGHYQRLANLTNFSFEMPSSFDALSSD